MDKLKNNKGFTIVELIMAMTIFTLIMLPVFYGFATVARINKLSSQQMKINAVVKQIKENVPLYFKGDDPVPQYDLNNVEITPKVNKIRDGNTVNSLRDIKVEASTSTDGDFYKEYKYDLSGNWESIGGYNKILFTYKKEFKKNEWTKGFSFDIFDNIVL